jgi:hypothetical protein
MFIGLMKVSSVSVTMNTLPVVVSINAARSIENSKRRHKQVGATVIATRRAFSGALSNDPCLI